MKNIRRLLSLLSLSLLFSTSCVYADGTGSDVGMYIPYGMTLEDDGGILFADYLNNRMLEKRGKTVSIIAGKAYQGGGYKDTAANDAYFDGISDVVQNSKGEFFAADSENNSIRKISDGKVSTWAGSNKSGYADGGRQIARFNSPLALAVDKEDNIYVADTLNHVIRKIDSTGNTTTIAGVYGKRDYVNGDVKTACFNEPSDIIVDDKGIIYVADTGNQCIRKIEGNTVSTIAGTPAEKDTVTGFYKGGLENGHNAKFNFPKGITLMDNGEILVADTLNSCIRKIGTDGSVTTLFDKVTYSIDEPVSVVYKNGQYFIAQRWTAGIKVINQGGAE